MQKCPGVLSFGRIRDYVARKSFKGGRDKKAKALESVAKSFNGFRPAHEVLEEIEAVRTIFPQLNVATRIGGCPASRLMLIHGPSNEGKTTLGLGIGLSFLKGGHFFAIADAERTTPPDWIKSLMGEYSNHPGFVALPVSSYEACSDGVRDFCEKVAKARESGDIPPETRAFILVDSVRKLVPKDLLKNLAKEGADGAKKRGVDGFGGRAGQKKAAMNSAWVDELIPLLADTKCTLAFIARETKDPDAGMFDEGIKVGGGTAIFYDSALALRVTRAFIRDKKDESKKGAPPVFGERHTVQIRKTKVAYKDESTPTFKFHTSNGVLDGHKGFDAARDILQLGLDTGIIQVSGSWYSYEFDDQAGKLGQGENGVVKKLHSDPELYAAIEAACYEVAL